MRVFIAIDIGEQIRKALGDLQQELQSKLDIRRGDVKWVNPDSIHLTLKFLGEIKDEKTVEVCNTVKEAAAGHEGFELEVESVGHFGGRSARVAAKAAKGYRAAVGFGWLARGRKRLYRPFDTLPRQEPKGGCKAGAVDRDVQGFQTRNDARRFGRRLPERIKAKRARLYGAWQLRT